MSIIFYLTFIYLIILVTYYFIYLDHITYDYLFTIILNFVFLITLQLYFNYFKDNLYSLIFSIALIISSFNRIFSSLGFFKNSIESSFVCNKIL